MNKHPVLLAVVVAMTICGCTSTSVRNASNTECERRLQSDRERCVRNIKSSDQALASRNGRRDDAQKSWEAETLVRLKNETGE